MQVIQISEKQLHANSNLFAKTFNTSLNTLKEAGLIHSFSVEDEIYTILVTSRGELAVSDLFGEAILPPTVMQDQ